MTEKQIEQLVRENFEQAMKQTEHPKKFFITENGRGVVDGGDLYNAVLKDSLNVMQIAVANIFKFLATDGVEDPPKK